MEEKEKTPEQLAKTAKNRENLRKAREAAKKNRETKLAQQQVPQQEIPKKHAQTQPWKPASLLSIPAHLQEKGMRYRFCKADKPGNILKKQQEGWVIDQELQRKIENHYGIKPPTLDDGKSLDSSFAIREMLVMKMPEDKAKSRDDYFQKLTPDPRQMKKKFQKDIAESAQEIGDGSHSGRTYGDITMTNEV